MTVPFPEVIDSSMLSTFRACEEKARLEYFEHWKPRVPSVHLHAGKAYAAGLEAMRVAYFVQSHSSSAALALGEETLRAEYGDFQCPANSAKSLDRMIGALRYYASSYPLETDYARPVQLGDKLAIEFSFAEPINVLHPTTGNPIILAGRADQIVSFAGGTYIEDDKTTSSLGPSWSQSWDLRSQFTHYCWAAARMGIQVDGVLIRGISILKTKYDTKETVTYRPAWMVERGIRQLERDVRRMIRCWEEGIWDLNLDHSCSDFGGCSFRQICLVQDGKPFLEADFQRRAWNPLTRMENVVE